MDETTESVVTESEDAWDAIDMSDVNLADPDEEPVVAEADQPTPEQTDTEPTDTDEPTAEPTTPDKQTETGISFDLKHLGETKTVNKDEIIVLAQKGLDYDRVKGNQDERLTFLDDLASRSGMTVKDLMENARTKFEEDAITEIAEKESCSFEVAKRLYNAEIKEQKDKATADAAGKQKQDEEAAVVKAKEAHETDIKAFLTEYPEIAPDSIKGIKEIWDMVEKGKPLVDAYRAYENKQLKAEMIALKKNKENKAKSTGSQTSAGNAAAKDPLVASWYED